jgi:hypothetical protein
MSGEHDTFQLKTIVAFLSSSTQTPGQYAMTVSFQIFSNPFPPIIRPLNLLSISSTGLRATNFNLLKLIKSYSLYKATSRKVAGSRPDEVDFF